MTQLTITDLNRNDALDHNAMSELKGGLTANINNSQLANQVVTGGAGPVFATNSPVSAPSTVLTESNPVTLVNMTTANLMNAWQNALSF